jgi:CDP-glycerol glycerophosphotransferase
MVVHAPTFRDEGLDGRGAFVPTEAIDLRRFAEAFGDRAVLVLRRHVLDRTPARIPPEAAHCVVDGSSVPDVQDLLVAADVLVTDYSSVAFDFLNTRRPCVFFAPDLETYRDRVRGFYLDEKADLPGPCVTDLDALMATLDEALTDGAIAGYDLERFAQRYCPHDDGAAAQRVVSAMLGAGV